MEELRTNIEVIKKQIESESFIKSTKIIDGISLECRIPEKKTYKQCQTELNKKCKTWGLLPVAYEQNEEEKDYFLVQFPELEPYYTEEQKYNMFYSSSDYFVKTSIDLSKRIGTTVTRKMLMDSIEKYIYEIIKLYYNSNVNKYKVTLESLENDIKLRNFIRPITEEVIVKYV